ncbi:MAG: prepilin-type N-terminal cleavage/methylation domain-containing protein [Acaryochloridaceae cyanobacterium RL_2_7]|nr:prepilin-type N-terminal cleavage/methylation domain-containing protein [Acaryochloridaceae cyanobacterium RL_2_7]
MLKKDQPSIAFRFYLLEGFTLLEMAIVIVIIGVLASLSAPSLLSYYKKFNWIMHCFA